MSANVSFKVDSTISKFTIPDLTITEYGTIDIPYEFNFSCIPISVTHLNFNQYGGKILPNSIPNHITHLDFGDIYNQHTKLDMIPYGTQFLRFGKNFNNCIDIDAIPNTVTNIIFNMYRYDQILDKFVIPDSVLDLTIDISKNYRINNGDLSSSIECIKIMGDVILCSGSIPSVKYLEFGGIFNNKLCAETIPESVTHLKFIGLFNQLLYPGTIPNSVKYLVLGGYYTQQLICGCIPDSVTHLEFGDYFDQKLHPGIIPEYVTHLTFGNFFNQEIKKSVIPNSVTILSFGHSFNKYPGPNILPYSITHLKIGHIDNKYIFERYITYFYKILMGTYNYDIIPIGTIPDSVVNLIINYESNVAIPYKALPKSVTNIVVNINYDKAIRDGIIITRLDKIY